MYMILEVTHHDGENYKLIGEKIEFFPERDEIVLHCEKIIHDMRDLTKTYNVTKLGIKEAKIISVGAVKKDEIDI